jgi:hypothetical protein
MKSIVFIANFCAAAIFGQPLQNTSVVVPVSSAPQLLIPVAGSTPGANGTFFRSDITIGNFATHDQTVRLQWLPQGTSSTSSTTINLRALSGIRSEDFVRENLGQSGLGAILVTGITSSGDVDSTAALYVASRIWSPQPGTGGTTSQTLPTIPTTSINTPDAAVFSLGAQNGDYRANIGFVNVDPKNEQTFLLFFPLGPLPFVISVAVPPMSMRQVALGTSRFFGFEFLIQNGTDSSRRSNLWVAYGSTVDNITGDAWSELAVPGAPNINPPGPIGKQ